MCWNSELKRNSLTESNFTEQPHLLFNISLKNFYTNHLSRIFYLFPFFSIYWCRFQRFAQFFQNYNFYEKGSGCLRHIIFFFFYSFVILQKRNYWLGFINAEVACQSCFIFTNGEIGEFEPIAEERKAVLAEFVTQPYLFPRKTTHLWVLRHFLLLNESELEEEEKRKRRRKWRKHTISISHPGLSVGVFIKTWGYYQDLSLFIWWANKNNLVQKAYVIY